MDEIAQKNIDFLNIYSKSHRLAAAVFMVSKIIDHDEELRTRIERLALTLVSMSVSLKDTSSLDVRKLITNIEKNSLELVSMLDIACVSNLISKMNGTLLKEEFQSFILELGKFVEGFESNKSVSIRGLFSESSVLNTENDLKKMNIVDNSLVSGVYQSEQKNGTGNEIKNNNGHRRKDLRKNTILEFIKGHNMVSIKDIAANVTGCSEKTIQRELTSLINETKIKKIGERRWSKYSII